MSTQFSTVTLATLGVGVNTAYTVAHGHDPFPTLLAGGLFMGGCVMAGAVTPELGTALAGVYLLATLIYRGEFFFGFLNNLVSGAQSAKTNKKGK